MHLSGDNNFSTRTNMNATNLTEYTSHKDMLQRYGEKSKIITNVDVMKKQQSTLIANGSLTDDDILNQTLKDLITDATLLLKVRDPAIQDIDDHYASYQNFTDIVNTIIGGD